MTIDFNSIPTNIRIPFVAVEFDSSKAQQGPALLAYQAILIGQKLAAGSQPADTVVRCASIEQAIAFAGRGSMLHHQAIGWFASNKSTPLWLGVLADNGAGVAATGTILVTAAATGTGTLELYIGGVLVNVGVNAGDATTAIATAIGAAINANPDLLVTATVGGSTVTLLFRHKGLTGNAYDVRANFRDGDAFPAGVALTITAMGGVIAGTTAPSLTNLIAAMAALWIQIWSHPYTDATTLTAIETELARRNGPMVQQQAAAITSAIGTFSALTTLGTGRNSPYSSIVAQTGLAPLTPPMEFAAEVAGLVAAAGAADPARPLQTLAMSNALATLETDQWSPDERNMFLFAGIATTSSLVGGGVQLERIITTYETSASGAPDTAYLDITTLLTLMYLRFDFRVTMQTKYPRHKLADDGTPFASGQLVMTPLLGKAEAVLWFRRMEALGLVEGFDQFKRDLVCERNETNPNQLDFLLPPNLINALIVVAAQIQFLL